MSLYSERAIAYLKEAYNEAAPLDQKLEVVDLDQFAEGVLEEQVSEIRSLLGQGLARADRAIIEMQQFYVASPALCPSCREAAGKTASLRRATRQRIR